MALVLAALVAASAGLYVERRTANGPEAALNGFFVALADRDAKAALSYLDSGQAVPEGPGPGSLLVPLKGSGYTPPTKLRIRKISQPRYATAGQPSRAEGTQRQAEIEYRLGGNTVRTTMLLSQKRGRPYRLLGGVATILVTASAGAPVVVNGAPMTSTPAAFVARGLLGRYTVGVADNPLWEAPERHADAQDGVVAVQLPLQVKASARPDIEARVKEYLNGCARSTSPNPPNCPFAEYTFSTLTNLTWTIDRYPTIQVDTGSDGQPVVTTAQAGRVSLSATSADGTPYIDSGNFPVSGTATLTNGRITFIPTS